jgi:hypothetical protein
VVLLVSCELGRLHPGGGGFDRSWTPHPLCGVGRHFVAGVELEQVWIFGHCVDDDVDPVGVNTRLGADLVRVYQLHAAGFGPAKGEHVPWRWRWVVLAVRGRVTPELVDDLGGGTKFLGGPHRARQVRAGVGDEVSQDAAGSLLVAVALAAVVAEPSGSRGQVREHSVEPQVRSAVTDDELLTAAGLEDSLAAVRIDRDRGWPCLSMKVTALL